MFLLCTETL